MATKAQKTKVGLFLLVCGIILAVGIVAITGIGGAQAKTYYMEFAGSVSGLNKGATVEFQGVPVGSVEEIYVTEANTVRVKISVRPDIATLRKGVQAQLASRGIAGIAFIQLSGGEEGDPPLPVGSEIPAEAGLLEDLVVRAKEFLQNMNELLVAIKTGDEQFEIGRTIHDLRVLLERAGEMIPSAKRGAQRTQEEIMLAVKELRVTLASIRRLVEMLEKDPSSPLHGKNTPRNGQP